MVLSIRWVISCIAALAAVWGWQPAGQPTAGAGPAETTIILVRHAEKADDSQEPVLSEAGRERAARLSAALRDAGVDTVYYSDRKRTRETAELAMKGWPKQPGTVKEYAATRPAAELAKMLRDEKSGSAILFVTHSNVIPPLLKSLGNWEQAPLKETDFGWIFVARVRAGEGVSLVRAGFPPS